VRLPPADCLAPNADCWYVDRRPAHAHKRPISPLKVSSLGRIVDLTGPICARADNLYILLKLALSGHHDWPVKSGNRTMNAIPLFQLLDVRLRRTMRPERKLAIRWQATNGHKR
jgi:hypothetical protein